MTLQDFKDQVAIDPPLNFKGGWRHYFQHCYDNEMWDELVEATDRVATLFAEHERKEGYKDGYRMGWDNRGLPDFLNPLTTPYKDGDLPVGGYAPGPYMCKCVTCTADFFGDKRAVQCLPCASGLSSAAIEYKNNHAPGR